jgi:hypothetical protein
MEVEIAGSEACSTDHEIADKSAGDSTAPRGWNDIDAPEPWREFRVGFHVMFSKRRGPDSFTSIAKRHNRHGDAIGIHSCPDMVEPAMDSPARIEVPPLVEVPLRKDGREVRAVSERANLWQSTS